jgi:outer membrane protein OmpA-like peptidoglycan-associated protein
MAPSLLGTIEEYLSADIVQRAAAFLGETPANTEKAVQSGVPAVLGGLIQQASTTDGAEGLLALVNKATQSTAGAGLTGLLSSGASMEEAAETGQSLLASVFGGKLSAIADLIASSSGIKSSSASSLLAMLAPLVLGIVGREAATRGGGVSGLMSLLMSQKSEVMSFLPSGLSSLVAGLGVLGAGGLGGLTKAAGAASASARSQLSDAATRAGGNIGRAADDVGAAVSNVGARIGAAGAAVGSAANEVTSQTSSFAQAGADSLHEASSSVRPRGWLLPAIVLGLVALGAWYFLRGRGAADDHAQLDEAAVVTPATPSAPAAGTAQGTAAAGGSAVGAAAADTAAAASAAGDRAKDAVSSAAEGTRGGLAKAGAGVSGAASAVVDKSKAAASKTASVTKDVASKTVDVSKDAASKTASVTKEAASKTADVSKDAGRKTAAVSKDVASKTGEVTKDAARATADAAKKVGGATKETAAGAAGAVASAFDRLTGRGEKSTRVTLPDGNVVKVPEGSANDQLAQYLETSDSSVKTFTFERIHFESGSTKLTRGSRDTLNHLAAILKAYPNTHVRLDGYTDNSGDADKNQALSQARADEIKARLVKGGIAASRLDTAGNGANNPIASNDTTEGRQQNRRIELVVTKR